MSKETIYFRLKEAAAMANVVEAAETGYVSLDDDSIRNLDAALLRAIDEIRNLQIKKVASAATLATSR